MDDLPAYLTKNMSLPWQAQNAMEDAYEALRGHMEAVEERYGQHIIEAVIKDFKKKGGTDEAGSSKK